MVKFTKEEVQDFIKDLEEVIVDTKEDLTNSNFLCHAVGTKCLIRHTEVEERQDQYLLEQKPSKRINTRFTKHPLWHTDFVSGDPWWCWKGHSKENIREANKQRILLLEVMINNLKKMV